MGEESRDSFGCYDEKNMKKMQATASKTLMYSCSILVAVVAVVYVSARRNDFSFIYTKPSLQQLVLKVCL